MAGSYAVLEVRDQGAGMDARTRARIFEPFFSTKGTGRGLGLSAVSGVVRGHGGAIKLRSTPGQGTSFLVLLPQSTREAQAIPTYRSSRIASKGRGKVLVVDDQPEVLKVTGKMLERAGFEALKASGGQEAIALAEQYGSELRVALVDLIMPGLGGEQVLAELKRLQPNLPVILITGFHERALHEGYRQRGFAGLLAKPFQIEDLSRVLQEALLRIDEV
jgi:CheY-like chemotaxis protein